MGRLKITLARKVRVFPAHPALRGLFPRSDGRGSLRAQSTARNYRPKGATEKQSAWLASAPAAYVMPMGNVSAREESQAGRRAERARSQAKRAGIYRQLPVQCARYMYAQGRWSEEHSFSAHLLTVRKLNYFLLL